MNIQTATPAEIDTELAAIYKRGYQADAEVAQIVSWIKSHNKSAAAEIERYGRTLYANPERLAELETKLESAKAERTAIWDEAKPYNAEFTRRGGWTRFFLVDNTGGHVHSSMDCNTCYATTQFAWLPQFSGQDEAGVVELAGESACTVCFPSAPVDVLKRASRIETPERKAAREEREAAKAERDRKAAERGITDAETGGPLVVKWLSNSTETLKTLVTARKWLTDAYDPWWSDKPAEDVAKVVAAVAKKEGKTEDQVREEARKRAAKRK